MAAVKEVLHEEKLYSIYCTNYHSVDGPLCRNEFLDDHKDDRE